MAESKKDKLVVEVSQAELDRIEKILTETTAKFIIELPELVRSRLEQSIAGMLGFEKNSWGGEWRVDHCNGRMSVISEMVGTKARQAVNEAMHEIDFKVTPEIKKAIKEEFSEQFRREMRDKLREQVSRTINEVLAEASAQQKIEIEVVGRVPTKKEVADPGYGKKPLERLIMDQLLSGNIKPMEENK